MFSWNSPVLCGKTFYKAILPLYTPFATFYPHSYTYEYPHSWGGQLLGPVLDLNSGLSGNCRWAKWSHWATWPIDLEHHLHIDIYKSHVWNHMESTEFRETRCDEILVSRVDKLTQDLLVCRCLQSFVSYIVIFKLILITEMVIVVRQIVEGNSSLRKNLTSTIWIFLGGTFMQNDIMMCDLIWPKSLGIGVCILTWTCAPLSLWIWIHLYRLKAKGCLGGSCGKMAWVGSLAFIKFNQVVPHKAAAEVSK